MCLKVEDLKKNKIAKRERMKQLQEVVKLVINKYIQDFNIIIIENQVILEQLQYRDGERDTYKSLKIEEFEDKFKVTFELEKQVTIVDMAKLEEIIITLQVQSKARIFSPEEVQVLKSKYTAGTRIELIKMYDYINPVPSGTKGIVNNVDDLGTIHINWENGMTAGVISGVDKFNIIKE